MRQYEKIIPSKKNNMEEFSLANILIEKRTDYQQIRFL